MLKLLDSECFEILKERFSSSSLINKNNELNVYEKSVGKFHATGIEIMQAKNFFFFEHLFPTLCFVEEDSVLNEIKTVWSFTFFFIVYFIHYNLVPVATLLSVP
jgi:hypothetical protein